MKAKTTWVLVADAGAARVYSTNGTVGGDLAEVPGGRFAAPRSHGQDIYSDRGGRSFDSHGEQRHAMEPPTSPQAQGRHKFAREIADWLAAPSRAKAFDRLAIAAEPKTLGALRELLPAKLREKVAAELPKDLTKATPAEIVAAFSDRIVL